jgi:hypothetical protein
MKLQIMSDLHFEMHADGGAELIRELDPTGGLKVRCRAVRDIGRTELFPQPVASTTTCWGTPSASRLTSR